LQLWQSFQQSGVVGQGVLLILLIFSVLSWATILLVWTRLGRAQRSSKNFLALFRRSKRLADVQTATQLTSHSPLAGLFRAGYAEIEAQVNSGAGGAKIRSLDSVQRALLRASRVEQSRLSRTLPFLATTASATPFIGLFGTVWGIMMAFQEISTQGSASITAVAPGISEALINTAAGLFAAIPALMAYNHFVGRLREARGEMDDFALEFLNLTERNFMD
jgi:biopolymer transport protein TolQ